jgi:hypothetical protein
MALQLAEVSRFLRSRVAKVKGAGNVSRFLVSEGYVDGGKKRVAGIHSFSPNYSLADFMRIGRFNNPTLSDPYLRRLKLIMEASALIVKSLQARPGPWGPFGG